MKFSRYVRLTMASVALLCVTGIANAAFYDLGTTILPAASGNASPGPTVTSPDTITLKGVWTGSTSAAGFVSGNTYTTSWYFTTALPGLFLKNADIANNGFANFSATLYDTDGVTVLKTLVAGTTYPFIALATAGTYRLDVAVRLVNGENHSYTFDAQVVPLPAAAWLLLSGVAGLGAMARRRKVAAVA